MLGRSSQLYHEVGAQNLHPPVRHYSGPRKGFWTGSKKTVQVGIGPISPNQIFSDSAPCGKVQVTWILLPELYSNVKPDCKSDCTTKGYLTS